MSYALALSNPGSDIDKYLSQVYKIPVLTREEEFSLCFGSSNFNYSPVF